MALGPVITEIATALAFVAPTGRGVFEITEHNTPPRYTWVRLAIDPSGRGGQPVNGTPYKILQEDAYQSEVHIWGVTEEDCEDMRTALVVAIRKTVKGRNYLVGSTRWIEPPVTTLGFAMVVPVTLFLQMQEVTLPTSAPTPAPPGDYLHPQDYVLPSTIGTIIVTDVDVDPTGAVSGDNLLQSGES